VADCGADRVDGSGGSLRSRCLSLAKTCSIGFRSGESFWQEEEFGADRAGRSILLRSLSGCLLLCLIRLRRLGQDSRREGLRIL
jgi:hypothetical protein